jgi:nitrate/TMAO reductase-like tetraheme cytochrome c subunit
MKRRLPDTIYNPVSMIGGALALVSFGVIFFLTFLEVFQENSPAYIGIVAYVALPVPLLIGVGLFIVGWWWEVRRRRRGLPASRMVFTVDFNIPRQRQAVFFFSTVASVFLIFTAYGSYRVFEWTESVEFCGETCHSVMEPEFTAYQASPHARVACVDCHVGSGADWYVRSKLSGAYQVYSVLANAYSRPIPTPIANLRPARETCEQCHWPDVFVGTKKVVNRYFRSDATNSPWTVVLLMRTGGGGGGRVPAQGIHWHTSRDHDVVFAAGDSLSQSIPWVQVRDRITGAVTEYRSTDTELTPAQIAALPQRTMSCIDCHNRPSHIYRPPTRIVDQSLALGHISRDLPAVRAGAIAALSAEYSSTEAAMDSIPLMLAAYFGENHPDAAASKSDLIAAAAEDLKTQFRQNIFPRMRVNWKAYPNNIGHMTAIGCFRCHDDRHVSADGKVLSKDCNSCHVIAAQGAEDEPATYTVKGLDFTHPEDIGEVWKETNCVDCHTGGAQ